MYGKCYYQSGPYWCKSLLPVRPGLVPVRAMEASQPFGGQCPRLPLKNETGTNPYYWTVTDPRGAIILNKWRLNKCYNSIITGFKHALQPSLLTMRMYCEQCACAAVQAVEYLNISGLVMDFATSPVRTANSFFGYVLHVRISIGAYWPSGTVGSVALQTHWPVDTRTRGGHFC